MPTSLFQDSIASGWQAVSQKFGGVEPGFRRYQGVAVRQTGVCEEGWIAGIKKAPSGAFFIFGVR